MKNNTDLAFDSIKIHQNTDIEGVLVEENDLVTTVRVVSDIGARNIGKPVGTYVTLRLDVLANDIISFDNGVDLISSSLTSLLPNDVDSVLVIGLGNDRITADSLGPLVATFVLATRHMVADLQNSTSFDDLFSVSVVSAGVLGETGIESAEIVKGIVSQISPSCVIVVDALASTSADRLGTTVQLSDTGISPGSGVGNHRHEISLATIGVPVISIGIPTVVRTSVISGKDDDSSFVTPREIDRISHQGAKLIGMGINSAFQKSLTTAEILSLLG